MFQPEDLFLRPELLFASTSSFVKLKMINLQAQLMKCIIKAYFTNTTVIFRESNNNYVIKITNDQLFDYRLQKYFLKNTHKIVWHIQTITF